MDEVTVKFSPSKKIHLWLVNDDILVDVHALKVLDGSQIDHIYIFDADPWILGI